MPVNTTHPQYDCHCDDWRTMRDVVQGHKAIQAAGPRYLPKLADQSQEEYKAYKGRATFFNATGRVVDALTGMLFRKDPVLENADGIKDILADMTLGGVPFDQFAESLCEGVMGSNRVGVLVEFPQVDSLANGGVITVPVAQQLGLRVYAATYQAEDIINWRTSTVGGKTVLSMVVLRERVAQIDPKDKFGLVERTQYRVLELVNGVYQQELHVETVGGDNKPSTFEVFGPFIPKRNGAALDFIPFEFFSSEGGTPDVKQPVLYDLAVVNLAHYRNDADKEHGLHFTGLPTAVISGVSDKDAIYRIGSATAWVFADADAKAAYLEFKGDGLNTLRQAMQDKEAQMAALGARMLAPEKSAAEAADTTAQKRQGENNTLAALANSVSRGLSRVLTIMAEWNGTPADVTVKLNTDFIAVAMPPQQITALLQAVMSGNLSSQSFYEALVKGEVVTGARTFEEEQSLIAEDAARQPDATAAAGGV